MATYSLDLTGGIPLDDEEEMRRAGLDPNAPVPPIRPNPLAPVPVPQDDAVAVSPADPVPTPAAPAPVAPLAQPTKQTTSGSRTSIKEVVTDDERQMRQGVRDEAGKQAGLSEREAAISGLESQDREKVARLKVLQEEEQANEQRLIQLDAAKKLEEANGRLAKERELHGKMGLKDFFAARVGEDGKTYKRTTGDQILAFLAVVMGTLGASLTKGPNYALEIIKRKEDRDFDIQRANIERQAARVLEAKQDAAGVEQWKRDRFQDLELKRAGAARKIAAIAEQMGEKYGTEKALLAGQQIASQKRQEADQREAGWMASEREKIQRTANWQSVTGAPGGAAGPRPTEGDKRLALLGQQMKGELAVIAANPQLSSAVLDKVQANASATEAADKAAGGGLFSAAGVAIGRGVNLIPKSKYEGLTEQEQKVVNAWDNAVEKYVRLLTGAGMPADEARRMATQNAPHAGDSPQLVQQKLARMNDSADQMLSLAGNAAATAGAAGSPGMAGAAAASAPSGRAQAQEAAEWLRKNPNHPKAAAVRAKMAELLRGQ